jgi:glucose-1-phosphate thymidylyltransferase
MQGIILAGGSGTRLYPLTTIVCKQLLPVYDKPMIFYPLATLMNKGIRDILIISTPKDIDLIKNLFGNGEFLGLHIEYKIQKSPKGIAEAFILGKDFIQDDVCLILGDNIFYGSDDVINEIDDDIDEATIFGYYTHTPERYGIVEFDRKHNIVSIEEKPINPKSNYAIPGLYFYPVDVVDKVKKLKPSKRNELEITDLNIEYWKQNRLNLKLLPKSSIWFDMGNFDSLLEASNYIAAVEKRQ